MKYKLSRKQFLTLAATSIAASPLFLFAQTSGAQKPKGDPLAPELVKEWVAKAHSDLARVKELYTQEPRLLNASWDWGGGDFESALEAAGHVGNRDIAEFLLANGARMNLFCAAMLGKLDIVRATLDAFPDLKNSGGPHGLKLKHHALKGGEQAKGVLEYLTTIEAG
ncbi:MAG TPA: hypothetical protein PK228_04615 [Saprospiraceae bacterium]|nr:hypothetical protein [Saprospiraceae bacterium]